MAHGVGLPRSSIARKQIVAITGLMLFGFVLVHLLGNLLIYSGPDMFNGYAEHLASLRPMLLFLEGFLALILILHIYYTVQLFIENKRARGVPYALNKQSGDAVLGARLMPITGPLILIYVVVHLIDFTFADRTLRNTMINNTDYGLYGLVYNSFRNPIHSVGYIVAMVFLGLHLTHAIQSAFQTFGFHLATFFPVIRKISLILGIVIPLLYISIPLSIWLGILDPPPLPKPE